MKIIFSSFSDKLSNSFSNYTLDRIEKSEVIIADNEKEFFDEIEKDNSDAYIIESHHKWSQKAADFINKINPYIPIIILMVKKPKNDINHKWIRGAEFYLFDLDYNINHEDVSESIIRCIEAYKINFEKLHRLTTKMKKEIKFGDFCNYDPIRRNFRYKNNFIKKLSPKEGGVLEILAANFGELVKKEIVMEKVWHKVDFYVGRSMDVYITNLRNLFKKHELPINIKNIPKQGLILEYDL